MKGEKCFYPHCEHNVIPSRSRRGLCPKHEEFLEFLLWALPQIKLTTESKTPILDKVGIWTPGQPLPEVVK